MKEFTVVRYEFSDLNADAQKKAVEKKCQQLYEDLDSSLITEILIDSIANKLTDGAESDLEDLKVYWSLSHSQGDGVAFSGRLYKSQAPALKFPEGVESVKFMNTSRYTHAHSFTIEYFDVDGYEIYDAVEGSEEFKQYWVDLSYKLEDVGYGAIEDYTSEEYAREQLEDDDDCIFLASGEISKVRGEILANA